MKTIEVIVKGRYFFNVSDHVSLESLDEYIKNEYDKEIDWDNVDFELEDWAVYDE